MTSNETTTSVVRLSDDFANRPDESLWARALRKLRRDHLTLAAMGVLLILTTLAAFAPFITEHILHTDTVTTNPANRLRPPFSPGHVLGTDDIGRDYLARLLHGGQISLAIGVFGAIIILVIGVTLGMIAGYYGGRVDDVMNWIITTLDSVPQLYLLILISSLLHPSPEALVVVLALTGWTSGTRLMRGQTIATRNLDYILSARALGAQTWRILFIHIFPNLFSLTIISLVGAIGGLILVESTLSFLNLGVQVPIPTWGNMLTDAQRFFKDGPHLAIIPGLMIFITVLCLYVVGDGLRDAFDPKIID